MHYRRLSLMLSASLLGAALVLGWAELRPEMSGGTADRLQRALARYDSLVVVARPARAVSVPTALALGYLERLRLGLGGALRLADLALHDPRLDDATRRAVAWALLGRVRRGDAYVVDPAAVDALGPDSTTGAAHVALIEHAVAAASDPRAGELTVRLAYALAAGERTVADGGEIVAAQAAALVRDRLLAQQDARDLLRASAEEGIDPLAELSRRRADRAFRVEQSSWLPLGADLQLEAMQEAPLLLAQIRALRGAASSTTSPATSAARFSLLGGAAAERLAALGSALPPASPAAVTLRSHAPALRAGLDTLAAEERRARARLTDRALSEEALAGELGRLAALGSDTTRAATVVARATLASAVAMRAFAQEAPWFPGDDGPTAADLAEEFGIANVQFDDDVPRAWRPYYLRLLTTSLRNAQDVLAGLSVDGLRVHFGVSQLPHDALAMHDPKTRTIQLSIVTSAGAIAHELAHDLDWQAARRLAGYPGSAGGGYSTDRAVRERRGTLASSIRGLATARIGGLGGMPSASSGTGIGERPTEVYARNVDWLVAAALGRTGVSDGFLSAVQDPLLTGYTAVTPSEMTAAGAHWLLSAVREMTFVEEPVRSAFLAQWGDASTPDPYLLVRRVLSASPQRRVSTAPPPVLLGDPAALLETSSRPDAGCAAATRSWAPEARARDMLADLALDARALGLARRRAQSIPERWRPAWARAVLGQAPWEPAEGERLLRRLRVVLAEQLDSGAGSAAAEQGLGLVPSMFRSDARSCGR